MGWELTERWGGGRDGPRGLRQGVGGRLGRARARAASAHVRHTRWVDVDSCCNWSYIFFCFFFALGGTGPIGYDDNASYLVARQQLHHALPASGAATADAPPTAAAAVGAADSAPAPRARHRPSAASMRAAISAAPTFFP